MFIGITILEQEGAEIAAKVFTHWAELFSCSPEVLELTGYFSWQVNNDPNKNGYERIVPNSYGYDKLVFNRDEVVSKLRILASYASQVRESAGDVYILHLGI
jgi:hypothetical protein